MPVKEKLTHRQRQALQTRQQIADAARTVFADKGYAGTTIAAIAAEADIPLQTVYSSLGTKAGIVRQMIRDAIGAMRIDEEQAAAMAEHDAADGMRRAAGIHRRAYEHTYDVIATFIEAARTDPDVAEDLRRTQDIRAAIFRRHLEAIRDALAPGLGLDAAVDVYVTLVLPEVYRSLVLERGWTPQQYESWLGDAFVSQLLAA